MHSIAQPSPKVLVIEVYSHSLKPYHVHAVDCMPLKEEAVQDWLDELGFEYDGFIYVKLKSFWFSCAIVIVAKQSFFNVVGATLIDQAAAKSEDPVRAAVEVLEQLYLQQPPHLQLQANLPKFHSSEASLTEGFVSVKVEDPELAAVEVWNQLYPPPLPPVQMKANPPNLFLE